MKLNQAAFDMVKPMPTFIYEMRQANRRGAKTQTRRVVDKSLYPFIEENERVNGKVDMESLLREINSPYGHPTDLRYMREPLVKGMDGFAYYQDDVQQAVVKMSYPEYKNPLSMLPIPMSALKADAVTHLVTGEKIPWVWRVKTLSGMYMPKFAARTFRRYEFIRIEHLQDISKADCIAEGMVGLEDIHAGYHQSYAELWESLNGNRGYSWESNPWVWVIGYKEDIDISQVQFFERRRLEITK